MKAPLVLLAFALIACSDEEAPADDAAGGSSSNATAAGGDGGGPGGSGGAGGNSCTEPVGPDPAFPKPTPADIEFSATNPLPSGEQILFNDWNPLPNTLHSIRPDGTGEIEIFRAYRVWSLAAAASGKKLAFACGDPLQARNYGIDIGDAIQHTWLYDVGTQEPSVLAWGNVNDECHVFSADEDALWLCRRWDFMPDGQSKGYQIARLDAACGTVELPTAPTELELELYPHPTADETALYYTIVEIGSGSQSRRIVRQALPAGAPEVIREDATLADLSPDGSRLLFADHNDMGALYTSNLEGGDVVKVSSHAGTAAHWSPQGDRIAFLWDETQICHHIEMVAADGSQADRPVRVRDCGDAFITALAW